MSDTITKEQLEKVIEEIRINTPCPSLTDMFGGQFYGNTLANPPVLESKHVQDLEPVIRLSDKLNVSTAFRNKCNEWYVEMFGYKQPIIWKTQYGYIMGPNTRGVLFGGSCV